MAIASTITKQELIDKYSSLKSVAKLLAACPHVIHAGIGAAAYIEELKTGSKLIAEYLAKISE